jgi:hypothetical protein
MKKILFLLFSMLSMTVAAQNEFAGSKWIGDICNLQTPIPEGAIIVVAITSFNS